MKIRIVFASILLSLVFVASAAARTAVIRGAHGITLPLPPPTQAKPVTETIDGVKLTDPYRWLEDDHSPATRAWIKAQMSYTEDYLSKIKDRPEIEKRLTELMHIEIYTLPIERQRTYFFTKRLPDENQASIYLRKGLRGPDQRLIDANALSSDQNTSVVITDVASDASLLVYGERQGGADETTIHVLNVAQRQDLPDSLPSARYNRVMLSPDHRGLFYSKLTPTGTSVFYHQLGTPASDQLVFGKSFNGETFGPMELISSQVTQNGRYLLITVGHGVPAKRVDIYAKNLRDPQSAIRPIVHGIDSRFEPLNYEDDLYLLTDYKAENYQVLKLSLNDPAPAKWKTIVPEGKDVISDLTLVGGKLFVTGLHNVVTQTRIFTLDGKPVGKITYPAQIGSASPVRGREASNEAFYSFESFTLPPAIYHYDVSSGKTERFAQPQVPFRSAEYDTTQVFYTSKDGTRIPMFISSKRALKRDSDVPTLLFAYGGFNISLTPHWSPLYAWWMEQGGFYAQPNLRGGGEYGETWHKAGMFEKKQNVFDDFYAAAEYLIANKYTSRSRLAIEGRSNGGLLMGAAMTQHPELFGAIWCGYPLLDMIRFQKFLIGRWWTTEYGSPDNPSQFPYILKYSPYQNVKPGTHYPAIMFNSGASDTRVAPLHARKMTALLQASTGGDRPILLHYETNAGHSSGVSLKEFINDTADELAFLWNEVTGTAAKPATSAAGNSK